MRYYRFLWLALSLSQAPGQRFLQDDDPCRFFPAASCTCELIDPVLNAYEAICNNPCQDCPDHPESCAIMTYSKFTIWGTQPVSGQLQWTQYGAQSFPAEYAYDEGIFGCSLVVNGTRCTSCARNSACRDGRNFDCTNVDGIDQVFNGCTDVAGVDSPFYGYAILDLDECFPEQAPPTMAPTAVPTAAPTDAPTPMGPPVAVVPPKKVPFDDSEDYRFYDANAGRGGITRRLRHRE